MKSQNHHEEKRGIEDEGDGPRDVEAFRAGEEVAALLSQYPKEQQRLIYQAIITIALDREKWEALPTAIELGIEWAVEKAQYLYDEEERLQFVAAVMGGLEVTSKHPAQKIWDKIRCEAAYVFWVFAAACNRALNWVARRLFG